MALFASAGIVQAQLQSSRISMDSPAFSSEEERADASEARIFCGVASEFGRENLFVRCDDKLGRWMLFVGFVCAAHCKDGGRVFQNPTWREKGC